MSKNRYITISTRITSWANKTWISESKKHQIHFIFLFICVLPFVSRKTWYTCWKFKIVENYFIRFVVFSYHHDHLAQVHLSVQPKHNLIFKSFQYHQRNYVILYLPGSPFWPDAPGIPRKRNEIINKSSLLCGKQTYQDLLEDLVLHSIPVNL